MNEVLRVNNISKVYGKQKVLDGVSLNVERGEIVGLVGPNGAGKTTLMKIVTKLITSYSGEVFIDDQNIKVNMRHETKQVGCVIETPGFYPELTGYENLRYFADISGLKDKKQIDEIVNRLGIEEYVHKKAKKYSLGMRQRLGVAQAVLTYPPILILDEPTNGLDPAIVPELRKFIKYIAAEKNTAVLISSHILSEIELMCDRVAFIQKGKIIKVESLHKEESDIQKIEFVTSKAEELIQFFTEIKRTYKIVDENKLQVMLKADELEKLVSDISKRNIPLRSVYEVKESLEQKYLRTMEEQKNA